MHSNYLLVYLYLDGFVSTIRYSGSQRLQGIIARKFNSGFLKAVELGVTTLELDVVISRDKKVVVSHESFFSPLICLDPSGNSLAGTTKKETNIYGLNYDQIQLYDCGSQGNSKFSGQDRLKVYKPLLSEVIDSVDQFVNLHGLKDVYYNIEIKSYPSGDDIFHPEPAEFTKLVIELIMQKKINKRSMIQSFDVRPLRIIHKNYPEIKLSLLIERPGNALVHIGDLGFKPDVYSPYFRILNRKTIKLLQEQKIKVIPWTINSEKDMKKFIRYGVDGIITDYPNLLIDLIKGQQQ